MTDPYRPPGIEPVFIDCAGKLIEAQPTAYIRQRPDGIYQWFVAKRRRCLFGEWRRVPLNAFSESQ